MKKKIPVFSVVCFSNVLLLLLMRNFSLTMLFPLALGIMALLVESKPELKQYVGYVALAWGVLLGLGVVRGLPNLIRSFSEIQPVALASMIYKAVYCVFALVAAINLITGKQEKTTGPAYFLIGLALTFGFMVTVIFQEVSFGNNNIFSVFINCFIRALPHLTAFGAIALLYGAFAKPESTPILDKKKISTLVFLLVVTAVMLCIGFIMSDNQGSYGGGYSAGSPGKQYSNFSDYLKDQDPDLYESIVDRYNSLTP